MYSNMLVNLLVGITTAVTVAVAVLIHYEGLRGISALLTKIPAARRRKVLLGVYCVILLHIAEIWLFGAAFWLLLLVPDTGGIYGASAHFLDVIYLSAATFSTLGFGDLAPTGVVRFLAGTESLTGFILITWSASFMYLEMQEFWRRKRAAPPSSFEQG
jgi:hypothetical protein